MLVKHKLEKSVTGLLLGENGSEDTFQAILQALNGLSNNDLEDLEDEIALWDETGFVGVYISELSTLLPRAIAAEAARDDLEPVCRFAA